LTTIEVLSSRIKSLEKELQNVLGDREKEFQYEWVKGKPKFGKDTLSQHRDLKHWLPSYLLQSEILAYITAPVIYSGVVAFGLLDLFLIVYQAICFPVYGVPKVRRADYIVFDRGNLKYLNLLERLNCLYCSYGNGVLAFGVEVAARTEQHWCPIKHAQRLRAPHSRYGHFIEFGDAQRYRREIETVRNDFVDVRTLTAKPPDPGAK
jgi:hypothetical protein